MKGSVHARESRFGRRPGTGIREDAEAAGYAPVRSDKRLTPNGRNLHFRRDQAPCCAAAGATVETRAIFAGILAAWRPNWETAKIVLTIRSE